MPDWVTVIIFSSVAVVYLFIISKLLGKKQIAQLEFIDYVMGISIGSIAAEMATDLDQTPWQYYLLGMTVFFLFDLFVSFIGRKGPAMKHFFKGRPEVIIYDGEIDYKNLKKSKLDVNDLISMCREKDYFDLSDIAFAIFETSGELSILPKSTQKPTVAEDLKLSLPPAGLPFYLVIDGHISYSSFTELKKDTDWMLNKLGITKKELKNILLATYDPETDIIDAQYKK